MNLAFLGSYIQNLVKKHPDQINWADGIFSKIFKYNLKKKPGRTILSEVIKNTKENNQRIVVIGNLEKKSKIFLERKTNKKIIHYKLPYGNISSLKKYLKIKFNKKDVCLITLPTPKQEMVAYNLAKNNKEYKIVCIGASINMLTGIEKPVPQFLSSVEFLWRLRYETKRRLFRLFTTFYYFLYGYLFTNKFKNLNVQID